VPSRFRARRLPTSGSPGGLLWGMQRRSQTYSTAA
jgi:hypothetical protein